MKQDDTIRVLLVDDNENDAINIRYLLRLKALHTYDIDWAATYEEGRSKAFANRYDVALFDYRLGAQNGIDLLRECQQHECRLPIILLTGAESPEIDMEASAAGASDYLNKNALDTSRLERSIRYSIKQYSTLEALRESQSRLKLFVKNMPAAIGIKDSEGKYLFVNEAFQQMAGVEIKDCIGRTDRELSPGADLSQREEVEREIFRTGKPVQMTERILHQEEERYWLANRFPMMPIEGPPLVGLAAIEITERVRTENRLRQTTQLLNGILTNLPVIAGRIDAHGNVVEIQGIGLKRFDRAPKNWIGMNLFEEMPQFRNQIEKALHKGSVTFLLEGSHKGESWYFENHFFFDSAKGEGAIFFSHDISSQKLLEQELLKISDEEQQRLGRDLHDGLGQQLTGVALLVSSLQSRLSTSNPEESEQARAITEHVQEAIVQTRALSRNLCPVHLEKYGLQSALEGLAHNVQNLYGIECTFSCNRDTELPNTRAATHLYRITQEAINNALKHGKARRITLSLDLSPNRNRLTIQDDGKGFDVTADQKSGMGLRLMEYRSSIIGGHLKVESKRSKGTRIVCDFPTSSRIHEAGEAAFPVEETSVSTEPAEKP